MDFKDGIPKGRIVPMYLTDEGDVYPIYFHSMEELDLIQSLIGGMLGHKVAVDFKCQINKPEDKISIFDRSTRETK